MPRRRNFPQSEYERSDPRWAEDHLRIRLERCKGEYIDSWPKWNNDDISAIKTVLERLQECEYQAQHHEPYYGGLG